MRAPRDANDLGRGVAEVIVQRFSNIIGLIAARDLTQAERLALVQRELQGWHDGLDLTPVPRGVVEWTSDHVRRAQAHLSIPPVQPEIAIKALNDAVALWRPGCRPRPRRSVPRSQHPGGA